MMISLVIPVYNEELLIEELFTQSMQAMQRVTQEFEIICVDDGSTDSTLQKLIACHQDDKRFKVLVLSRNFGHQAAYTAGLQHAKGEYVAMMDGDLQDPPDLIAEMHRKLITGEYDVVYGKRKGRQEAFMKKMLIKSFHSVFKRLSRIEQADNVGNFSMMNRKALEALLSLREKNRYLPGIRFFIGFRQGYVEYDRQGRSSGEAKMSTKKLFNLAFDAIFSFSNLPIKVCLYTGLVGIIVFMLAGLYVLIDKLTGRALYGWSSTVLSIYFLGSVQLVFLGVLGEYVFRIYRETQNRPMFIVRDYIE
jgi:dolichol-phosphate mannosyltransferase